jgi:hypothetical protein
VDGARTRWRDPDRNAKFEGRVEAQLGPSATTPAIKARKLRSC